MGAWTTPTRMAAPEETGSARASVIFGTCFVLLLLAGGGIWLAYRNYSRGKGDRRGAMRMAKAVFALEMVVFVARAQLSFSAGTLGLAVMAISAGLFVSGALWVLYIALEPYVRSKWPQTIVSWSRLLSGSCAIRWWAGTFCSGRCWGWRGRWCFLWVISSIFDWASGLCCRNWITWRGFGRRFRSGWDIIGALVGLLLFFFVLVPLRVVVRNRWLVVALFVIIFTTPKIIGS